MLIVRQKFNLPHPPWRQEEVDHDWQFDFAQMALPVVQRIIVGFSSSERHWIIRFQTGKLVESWIRVIFSVFDSKIMTFFILYRSFHVLAIGHLDSIDESLYLGLLVEIQWFKTENCNGILGVTDKSIFNASLASKFQNLILKIFENCVLSVKY